MLREPQERVRDDVVVARVGNRVVGDEHDVAATFGGDRSVFVRDRTRDPGDVVLVEQPT
jgi:hypothetical protein